MSNIKQNIRNNNAGLSENSPKFLLKQQSIKENLRKLADNQEYDNTPYYSSSLREKYLKQGSLTIEQKKFLNMTTGKRVVKKGSTGFSEEN